MADALVIFGLAVVIGLAIIVIAGFFDSI